MPDIDLIECKFNISDFEISLFQKYKVQLPQTLLDSNDKRKCEFLAGRFCAQRLVKSYFGQRIEVSIGHNRHPVFPKGMLGTISHTEQLAICAGTVPALAG